jgi:hypothetical protein
MSLQALEWRKLPVRTFQVTQSVSTVLNTIYDMLTGSAYFDGSSRVAGSGSAWVNGGIFRTGSNAEAVYCFPPVKTEVTQSVIFAGKQPNGASSSAAPYLATYENTFLPGYLYGACVEQGSSSSFTQWTGIHPYGSSSFSTGYATFTQQLSTVGSTDKITIYESKEAIAVFVYDTVASTNCGIIAGAIIDPEQSSPTSSFDAEADGRLYGILTSGTSGISTEFLRNLNSDRLFLTQNIVSVPTYGPRFLVFAPSISPSQTTMGVATEKNYYNNGFYVTRNYTSISGKFVNTPLKCVRNDTGVPSSYLGRLRDITLTRHSMSGLTIRDNATNSIIGYTISAYDFSSNDTILLNHS